MGYLSDIADPMGWDGFKNFPSHPIPSHGTQFFKNTSHGWDGMGWDGMGLSHPTRSPALYALN